MRNLFALCLFLSLSAQAATCGGSLSLNGKARAQAQVIPQREKSLLEIQILGLKEELIAILAKYRETLDRRSCNGASATLNDLMKKRLGVEANYVHNGYHTFLRIRDYFREGVHLYIDPTFQQFVPEDRRTKEKIFVGTSVELSDLLYSMGAREDVWKPYFRDLRPPAEAPACF